MNKVGIFDAGHEDLIHDIAYDEYGTRLITCSSDQKIKVWDWNQSWELNDSFKAHDGSVLKACWAHPEFGQVFASCSFDRTIRLWEEMDHEPKNSGKRWFERKRFNDAKGTVQKVVFSPHHLGLKLASCESFGIIRVYECLDPVNLLPWEMAEIEISPGTKEPEGYYSVDWCSARHLPPMLVIACGKENLARIYILDKNNKWLPGDTLTGHSDLIRDVAWAPTVGRSYQLIATACKDGHVRIFKLTQKANEATKKIQFQVDCVADLTDHADQVWRVSWNITGTVLSSSGDDGTIRLWKCSFSDEWKQLSIISAQKKAE